MIFHSEFFSTFTVPLGQSSHRLAEQFCQHHKDWQKAEQVYLNTLAVYAVDYYLKSSGYVTDWQNSDSYNRAIQALMDVADLIVKDYGKLECRVVSSDAETVYIPQEVWGDRLAYLAVCLNAELDEAEILGFLQQVNAAEVPLNQLQPLDNLPDYLCLQAAVSQTKSNTESIADGLNSNIGQRVQLRQWLQNIFSNGWLSLEEFMAIGQPQFAFQFRNFLKQEEQKDTPVTIASRAKLVELGSSKRAVLVQLTLTSESETSAHIQIEILPTQEHLFLPAGLQLAILDEREEMVMQAKTQETNDGIRLEFTADTDTCFSIKISLDELAVTEAFLV